MKRQLLKLAVITVAILLWVTVVTSVRAQEDQETVEPALATAVADQLATDFPLMTQTADALTPTVEPTPTDKPPADNDIDITIEQPPVEPPPPTDNSQAYLFALAVIAVIVIAAMGYLMERKDPNAAAKLYEDALRRAYDTKGTPYDEVGLEAWLSLRGFKVTRDPDGTLHVIPPVVTSPLDIAP